MAFAKKTWKDRVAEFINRRTLTKEDGSTELVTVARSEGTISVEGDAFNAETMNDLEQRIADEFDSLNADVASLKVTAAAATVYDATKLRANGLALIHKIGKLAILHADIGILARIEANGCILNLPSGYRGGFNNIPVTIVKADGTTSTVGLYTSSSDGYAHIFTNVAIPAGYGLHINIPYLLSQTI